MGVGSEVGSNVLLFALVFGMSATVDTANLRKQLKNRNALLTGIFLQFVVLPFLGFAVVKALDMSSAMGITLLVVTSSPGGSYSNWWCSMFNADLALSVTMTAISTLMSIIMLPVNLVIYATSSYSGSVVKSLDWVSLFVSLVVVIGAISFGLFCSAKINSHRFNLFANKLGNVAGISLVVFSVMISSSDNDAQLWDREWKFYLGVASPCVLGLVIANFMTSFFRLLRPERVTVSVECCYQNVGIATSVAITMFEGDELAEAVGVPLFYGLVEAIVLGVYCIGAWKMGWTKAPKDESFCVVVFNSYEVEHAELHDLNAIEVVLGVPKDGLPTDLFFHFDEEEGYTVDEGSLVTISYPSTPESSRVSLDEVKEDQMKEEDEEKGNFEENVGPGHLIRQLEPTLSTEETDGKSYDAESPEAVSPASSIGPYIGQMNGIANSNSLDSLEDSYGTAPVEKMNGAYAQLPLTSPESIQQKESVAAAVPSDAREGPNELKSECTQRAQMDQCLRIFRSSSIPESISLCSSKSNIRMVHSDPFAASNHNPSSAAEACDESDHVRSVTCESEGGIVAYMTVSRSSPGLQHGSCSSSTLNIHRINSDPCEDNRSTAPAGARSLERSDELLPSRSGNGELVDHRAMSHSSEIRLRTYFPPGIARNNSDPCDDAALSGTLSSTPSRFGRAVSSLPGVSRGKSSKYRRAASLDDGIGQLENPPREGWKIETPHEGVEQKEHYSILPMSSRDDTQQALPEQLSTAEESLFTEKNAVD